MYPETALTVYGCVPFGSVKAIEVVAELLLVPFRVTDQDVAERRPVSVNVTAYFCCVQVTVGPVAAPLTLMAPE